MTAPLGHRPALMALLARKVLEAHLHNRNQLMDAGSWDLRMAPREDAPLLIRAMIAAIHADGQVEAQERARVLAAINAAPLSEDDRAGLEAQVDEPECLEVLVRQLASPRQAVRFYAASAMAVGRARPITRAYLTYLAQRLHLPADQVVRINRRMGTPD